MTNEITKQLMAICIRNGVVLWIEKEKADTLFEMQIGRAHV